MDAVHPSSRTCSGRQRGRTQRFAGAVLVASLALCVLAAGRVPWSQPRAVARAWPPAPDAARIRFVGAISEPRDIGAGPGALARVWRLIAGGSRQPRLARPSAIATDSTGRLIVSDVEQQMVHVFDVAREKYSYLQSAPFASPVGLATGADDTIYVADSGRRAIFVYGPDGRLRRTLGRVNNEPIFIRPSGVALGPDGLLYVVDAAAAAITALSPEGRVIRTFGRRGAGPGEFNYPTHLAFGPDGLLYVVDALNARLQVLQRDGAFVRAFGRRGTGTGDFDKPKGIAFDPDGHVYVADGLHDIFQIFDTTGRLLLVVGESGAGPGQFAFPSSLHIDRNGRIYVADALNGRVEVFEYLRRTDAD